MELNQENYRTLGRTGLRVPPVVFDAAVLCDERHVVADPVRVNVVAEWFKRVEPPVFVEVSSDDVVRQSALIFLSRVLAKFEIAPEEVAICVRVDSERDGGRGERLDASELQQNWEEACQLLGSHAPMLATIGVGGDRLDVSQLENAVERLRSDERVVGVGVAGSDLGQAVQIASAARVDYCVVTSGYSLFNQSREALERLQELEARQVAVIHADPFDGGWLSGGDGAGVAPVGVLGPDDEKRNRWRRSFSALCHGHGVSPGQACVQFALASPGVVAVGLAATHADRVAEQVEWVATDVPVALWEAMREEGLVEE